MATPAPEGVRRVAMDPLLTSGMILSGRLAPLPPGIFRVGGEIRPSNSVEKDRPGSGLPFRSGAFTRVHCGFVLHLYLEVLGLLAEEARRVLAPQGEFTALLPHFGDARSERILEQTLGAFRNRFGNGELARFQGPFTTFWADLYQGRTFRIRCRKE